MKKIFQNLFIIKKEKGFTLFIALIVSSILLTVGFSIGNIILKQLQLSSNGSDSEVAFYAADSAAECALYWDRKDQNGDSVLDEAFGTSTPQPSYMKCGSGTPDGPGAVYVESKILGTQNDATTTFYIDYHDVSADHSGYSSCAKVMVGKSGNNTVIDARGYNALYSQTLQRCDVSNPRTVERGLLLTY